MEKKKTLTKIGSWSFVIGMILALLGGISTTIVPGGQTAVIAVLIVLGLIVGFLNVTENETKDFLLAAVSLVIVTSLGGNGLALVPMIGPYLQTVFMAIMTFVVPATIIVAIKAIYALAKDE